MATFPAKTNYAAGDILTAAQMVDIGDQLNALNNYVAGKNRLINGDFCIDQRNSGAAQSTSGYTLDRWSCFRTAANGGTFTTQQVSDAPAGFNYSLKASNVTNSTGSAVWIYQQQIEAFNVLDFNLGLSTAATFTLSFWVKSTTTGTYSGHFGNGITATPRTYVFTYTINAANTWEKKTVTIIGDTSGTWNKNNLTGLKVLFNLGNGGNSATAGVWNSADNVRTATAVGLDNVTNATWQITGVQLELGSIATNFSRAAGTLAGELAACQRYYWRQSATTITTQYGFGSATTTTTGGMQLKAPVTMRRSPTAIDYSNVMLTDGFFNYTISALVILDDAPDTTYIRADSTGLTQFRPLFLRANATTSSYVGLSAEL